jgi:plastocyanin
MRVPIIALSIALALTVPACSDDEPTGPPAGDNEVAATPQLAFSPQTLQIAAGETVTWVFGSVAHNVNFAQTAAGRPADIAGQNANTSVPRTFAAAGTFPYVCTLHPGMSGTIVVGGGTSQIVEGDGDTDSGDAEEGDGGDRGYGG